MRRIEEISAASGGSGQLILQYIARQMPAEYEVYEPCKHSRKFSAWCNYTQACKGHIAPEETGVLIPLTLRLGNPRSDVVGVHLEEIPFSQHWSLNPIRWFGSTMVLPVGQCIEGTRVRSVANNILSCLVIKGLRPASAVYSRRFGCRQYLQVPVC